MKRALLPACLLAMAAASVLAQQQEQGLLDRIDAKQKLVMQAMNGSSKRDPSLSSPLSSQSFAATTASVKTFHTSSFGGLKSASIKTFETHSFFGVKNPWFGRKIFETYANRATDQTAKESSKDYETQAFAVREYDNAKKQDAALSIGLPAAEQPKPYLVAPKAPGAVDRFTQNLQKELSIDDVRDLLNKGNGE